MSQNRPTYEELLSKLAETEGLLTRLSEKLEAVASQRDTALLGSRELEEAYIESEENFRNSMDACPLGVRIVTEDGDLIYANQAILDICGCGSVEEMKAVPRKQLYTPESYAVHQERIEKRKRGESIPPEYEMSIRRPDGAIRNLLVFRREVIWGGERQFMAMYQDITERKGAEEALRESEEKYRGIVEQALVGIGLSKGNHVIFANKTLLRILNYDTLEEFIKIPLLDSVAPSSRKLITDRMAMVAEGKIPPPEFEYDILCKGGMTKTLLASSTHLSSGGEVYTQTIFQDVTDRNKAEEALRESEERFRALFETMAQGVVYQDANGEITTVNPAAERILGLTISQMQGRKSVDPRWKSLREDGSDFPGDQHPSMVALLTGKPVNNVIMGVYNPALDERRWILISAIPEFKVGESVPYRAYTTFTDITERRKLEEALERQHQESRLIIDSSPILVFYKDKEGKILRANKAFAEALNRPEERIVGKTVFDLYSPEIAQNMTNDDNEVLKSGRPKLNIIEQYESATGLRWVQTDKVPIFDKNGIPIGLVGFAQDITEQKQAEEALRESEAKYHSIFNNSKDAILLTSPDGSIHAANPAACKIFGRTEEEICRIGRNGLLDTSDPRLKKALEQRRATGEFMGELTFVRSDGTRFPGDISTKIFIDKDGKERTSWIIRDITERKRAEEVLLLERDFNKSVFDTAQAIMLVLEPDGRIVTYNPYLEEISGYKLEEMRGKYWFDTFIPERDREKIRSLFGRAIDNIQTKGNINVIVTKDGREREIEWYDKTLKDINGKVVGLLAVGQDITERKLAEEKIRESEERFSKAFHASPDLMAISDLQDGRIIDVNREYCRVSGYQREELLGHTAFELDMWANPEQRSDFYKIINDEGQINNSEIELRTKTGNILTLFISAEKINLHDKPCLLTVALDITARKQAEERINHLNLTLRSIRDVNQLITKEKDRDRLIQGICDAMVASRSFNSAWIVLLDESKNPTAWAGANIQTGFSALVESMKRWEYPRCVQKALKQKQTVVTEDPPAMCPGCPMLGDIREIGSLTIRLEIQGTVYGILCASLPRRLMTSEDEISLFKEVATDIAFALHNIELSAEHDLLAQERLRTAKLESIGTLAGGIAHDFNNLLTGIMGNIGLVKTYVTPSEATYDMLDEAEKAAVRARDLTQQLLTYARGGRPVKKPIKTAGLIKESAAFALRGSNVRLELSLPDDLWSVEADEGQIGQVINNLVINADEAMPSGGILNIEASNCALKKVSALPLLSGSYVRIDIKDTGMGISKEHLQRIFEPYFTTKQKGSGLGLSTVYSIIKNHGGYILPESKQNEGSTFHIYLPASKKTAKGEKQMAVAKSGQAGGKVLVMDDEEVIRKMLKNMLNLAGYEVELTADGTAALEKYAQALATGKPFFAVIMDLTIPGGMGGKEAIKKLLEIDPQATAIVSSGYATDPIMSEYKKHGFKAVIAKPYSIKQLRETLSGLSHRKKKQAD